MNYTTDKKEVTMIYDELNKYKIIPDAYERWTEYRNAFTNTVLNFCKEKSVLIVGAGACNDLDIKLIAQRASSVTLLDRDEEVIQRAFAEKDFSDNVTLCEGDFVGISDDDYRRFTSYFQYFLNVDSNARDTFPHLFVDKCMDLLSNARPFYPDNKYDYVISSAVHSQLLSSLAWLWQAFSVNLGITCDEVYDFLKREDDRIVREYNNAIIKLSRQLLTVSLEKKNVFTGAVEGAFQGLNDLNEREKKGLLYCCERNEAVWPFSSGTNYIMAINTYRI